MNPPVDPEIVIQLDWSDEPRPTYATGVQVVATPRDVALFFVDFAAAKGRGGAAPDEPPKAKVVGTVRVTPDVLFELAFNLASAWNEYANATGDPGRPQPKYKLMSAGGRQVRGLTPT